MGFRGGLWGRCVKVLLTGVAEAFGGLEVVLELEVEVELEVEEGVGVGVGS